MIGVKSPVGSVTVISPCIPIRAKVVVSGRDKGGRSCREMADGDRP